MAGDERLTAPPDPVSPYCYRVLTPWLVSLLPGPVVTRFLVFNHFVWWAVLTLWHLLARRTGLDRTVVVFGALILATCAWGPMNAFYNPCYVDPLMYLLVVVGLYLMLTGNSWFVLLLPVAILQREQVAVVLFLSGVACEISRQARPYKNALRYALALAACMSLYLGLRHQVTPASGVNTSPWATAFQVARWLYEDPSYILISLLAVAYALSVPLIGVCCLPEARRFIKRNRWTEYYLFVCLLCLFGGSDKGRLVFLAQPVLLLALLHGMKNLSARVKPGAVMAALLVLHLLVQFPPWFMVSGGKLIAPLVDDPDRGTHAASWILPVYWPVSLYKITWHLACTLTATYLIFRLIGRRIVNGTRRIEVPRSPQPVPTP